MIRSMTGFGEASGRTSAGVVRFELRAVNHRYLNFNARLPTSLTRWEPDIREWLRSYFARGHINCTARWETDAASGVGLAYRLDGEKVVAYQRLFQELSELYGIPGNIDLALLTRFNDVIVRNDDVDATVGPEATELREIVEAAAKQVVTMRDDEGKRLDVDLRERLAAIAKALDRIQLRSPERLIAERQRLSAAVHELLGGVRLDEARLAQEIAILAERWDLNEELVRFRSHNELFSELLEATAEDPVGKRLSFLVQEMHREANTIGSKANDSEIAHLVVGIKDELERLREQVENVE